MHTRRSFISTSFSLIAVQAFAQDTGLYGKAAPPDSSYVRLICDRSASIEVGGVKLSVTQAEITDYEIIPAGEYLLSDQSVILETGYFYSLLSIEGKIYAIKDDTLEDKGKSALVLYNMTDLPIALLLSETGQEVLTTSPDERSAMRVVNPVSAELALSAPDMKHALPPISLNRQTILSIAALKTKEGISPILRELQI